LIYRKRGYWEDLFTKTNVLVEQVLHAPFLEETPQVALGRMIQPRPDRLSSRCLNLSGFYNATLFHLSQINYEGILIEHLTNAVETVAGTEFDTRGLVHLAARRFPIPFPEDVKGIAVDRKCAQIHLLHGTEGVAPTGATIAKFIFNLENGATSTLEIIYGKHVKTRWFDRENEGELENPKPAFVGLAEPGTPRSLRLYLASWVNPEPDVKVKSIDFVSAMTTSAPFLVAITTE